MPINKIPPAFVGLSRLERAKKLGFHQTKVRDMDVWYNNEMRMGEIENLIGDLEDLPQDPKTKQKIEKLQKEWESLFGKPLPEKEVLSEWYHSSPNMFKSVGFDKSRLGESTGAPSAHQGFFFASNPKVAQSYLPRATEEASDAYIKAQKKYDDLYAVYAKNPNDANRKALELAMEEWRKLQSPKPYRPGSNFKTHLRMQNPYVHDMKGKEYRDESYYSIIKRAKAQGHDSVIIKNTYDPGSHEAQRELTDIAVVFEPDQVRVSHADFDPRTFRGEGASKLPQIQDQINKYSNRKFELENIPTSMRSTDANLKIKDLTQKIEKLTQESQQIKQSTKARPRQVDIDEYRQAEKERRTHKNWEYWGDEEQTKWHKAQEKGLAARKNIQDSREGGNLLGGHVPPLALLGSQLQDIGSTQAGATDVVKGVARGMYNFPLDMLDMVNKMRTQSGGTEIPAPYRRLEDKFPSMASKNPVLGTAGEIMAPGPGELMGTAGIVSKLRFALTRTDDIKKQKQIRELLSTLLKEE